MPDVTPPSPALLIAHARALVAGDLPEARRLGTLACPGRDDVVLAMTLRLTGAIATGFHGGTIVVDRRGAGPLTAGSAQELFCRLADHIFADEPEAAYAVLGEVQDSETAGELLATAAAYLVGILDQRLNVNPGEHPVTPAGGS